MAGLSSSLPFLRQRRGGRKDRRIMSQAANSFLTTSSGHGRSAEKTKHRRPRVSNRAVGDPGSNLLRW